MKGKENDVASKKREKTLSVSPAVVASNVEQNIRRDTEFMYLCAMYTDTRLYSRRPRTANLSQFNFVRIIFSEIELVLCLCDSCRGGQVTWSGTEINSEFTFRQTKNGIICGNK